jgi:peptidoglycan hydrolase-like protein with peptidoglycan-binding domain
MKTVSTYVGIVVVFLCVAFCIAQNEVEAQDSSQNSFTVKLSLGMTHSNVIALQRILNADVTTRVAERGPGSPGNETEYFGQKTRDAVIVFQNKYAQDVLAPAGLSQGNGFVGPFTLKKLSQLSMAGLTNTNTAATNTGVGISTNISAGIRMLQTTNDVPFETIPPSQQIDIFATDQKIESLRKNMVQKINQAISSRATAALAMDPVDMTQLPVLISTSLHSGSPGMILSIRGSGYTKNNTVYFGPGYRVVSQGSTGEIISLKVPNLPPGRYDIVVKNENGLSNSSFFIITESNSPKVMFDMPEEVVVKYGDVATLRGKGFSATNEIVTSFGKIQNVTSSDGVTLSFRVNPDVLTETAKLSDGSRRAPMEVQVVNEHGYTATSKFIQIAY